MELNVLLRGQSNSVLFDQLGGSAAVKAGVERLLGFDGVANRINLVGTSSPDANGHATMYGGTALLPGNPGTTHWLDTPTGDWRDGFAPTPGGPEANLLAHLASLPAAIRAAPTLTLWMHNEYDGAYAGTNTAEWAAAVRYDAGLVRAALGQGAATTPYLFTDVVPWDPALPTSMQAIKRGMEQLAADPSFGGGIAAHVGDLNMDSPENGYPAGTHIYGGPHMSAADVAVLAPRLTAAVADTYAAYALPGSPMALAGGHVPYVGPQAMRATVVPGDRHQLIVDVKLEAGSGGLAPLGAAAAAGVGWSVMEGGTSVEASGAKLLSRDQILLTFADALPADGAGVLYYGYGDGRIAAGADDHRFNYTATNEGSPGQGSAIYDDHGLPIWTAATGVTGVPTLAGARAQYVMARTDSGALYVHDTAAPGADQVLQGVTTVRFADGTGMFDPTGAAADLGRLYEAAFGRVADVGGLALAADLVNRGAQTVGSMADIFLHSPEFTARFGAAGTLSDTALVTDLYANALGRAPEAAGLAHWVAALGDGYGRADLVRSFALSPEAKAYLHDGQGSAPDAAVYRVYEAALGRAPDAAENQLGVGHLTGGGTVNDVATGLAATAEFITRHAGQDNTAFATEVYADALQRAPDAAGLAGWVGALDAGFARAALVAAFADGTESRLVTAAATHDGMVWLG